MLLHVLPLVSESFITNITPKRIVSSMFHHMPFQFPRIADSSSTDFAFESTSLFRMCEHVFFKVLFAFVLFSADRTARLDIGNNNCFCDFFYQTRKFLTRLYTDTLSVQPPFPTPLLSKTRDDATSGARQARVAPQISVDTIGTSSDKKLRFRDLRCLFYFFYNRDS